MFEQALPRLSMVLFRRVHPSGRLPRFTRLSSIPKHPLTGLLLWDRWPHLLAHEFAGDIGKACGVKSLAMGDDPVIELNARGSALEFTDLKGGRGPIGDIKAVAITRGGQKYVVVGLAADGFGK